MSYEVGNDPELVEEFYYNMYLPYINSRHQKEALIGGFQTVKNLLLKGFLLLIKADGAVVAGSLVVPEKDKIVLKILGVKDGKDEYMRLGVIGATYYFGSLEAQKRGYKTLDIGRTRVLFTNGVTKYKISLKAKLIPKKSRLRNYAFIKFLRNEKNVRDFLTHNPFLYYKENQDAYRAMFVDEGRFDTEENFRQYFMSYRCEGLAGTSIFVFGDMKKIEEWVGVFNDDNIAIESAESLFNERKQKSGKK